MAGDVDGEREGAAPAEYQRILTPDELRLAARAGDLLIATTPGAPRGVIAPGGLPRAPRLVGRDALIEQTLAALSAQPPAPIVSISGPRSQGKSALAAEVVALAAERDMFPGGAIWLACESLSGDPGLAVILAQVTTALGDAGASPPARALIVLDHVESTLDASALLDALAPWNCALLLTADYALQDDRVREIPLGLLDLLASSELARSILRQVDARRPMEADEEALFDSLTHETAPLALSLSAARIAVMGLSFNHLSESGVRMPLHSLNTSYTALPEAARRAWAGLALIAGASFPRGIALAVVGAAIRENADAAMDESWREEAAETLDALIGLRMVATLAPGRLALLSQARQVASAFSRDGAAEARDIAGAAMANWWLEYARAQAGLDSGAELAHEAAGLLGAITWAHARQRHQLLLDLIATLPAAVRALEESRLQAWAAEARAGD